MMKFAFLFLFFLFPTQNYASFFFMEKVQNNISPQSSSSSIGDYCNEPDISLNKDQDEKTREEIIREMDNSFFMALNQFEECNVESSNNFGQNEGIGSGGGSPSGYGSGQSTGSNSSNAGSEQSNESSAGSGQSNESSAGSGGAGYTEDRDIPGTVGDIGGQPLWDLDDKKEGVLKKQLLESCEVFVGNEKSECIKEMETLY